MINPFDVQIGSHRRPCWMRTKSRCVLIFTKTKVSGINWDKNRCHRYRNTENISNSLKINHISKHSFDKNVQVKADNKPSHVTKTNFLIGRKFHNVLGSIRVTQVSHKGVGRGKRAYTILTPRSPTSYPRLLRKQLYKRLLHHVRSGSFERLGGGGGGGRLYC